MNLLTVRIDTKEVNRVLKNAVRFSYGFLDGIEIDQIQFNTFLGEYTVDALCKYIDSKARMSPQSLHHVYEWDMVGNESSRLFVINSIASKRVIRFSGKFLPSKTIISGSEPFVNKAEVMENGIAVTIEPRNSDVLAFEDEGETVFTASSVYVAHPGGDEVAGSFGRTVDDFFSKYFTNAFLAPLINDLGYAKEYDSAFKNGVRGNSRMAGVNAGKKFLDISSLGVIE